MSFRSSGVNGTRCDLNRPGLPEAISFELRRDLQLLQHGVVVLLSFGWRDVANRLQQPAVVKPIDPFQRRKFDALEGAPWSAPMDDFGLVEAVDRFSASIVVAVADTADGGLDARLGQPLGVVYL